MYTQISLPNIRIKKNFICSYLFSLNCAFRVPLVKIAGAASKMRLPLHSLSKKAKGLFRQRDA